MVDVASNICSTLSGGLAGGANQQPALWDSIYLADGYSVRTDVAALPFEGGSVNTRLTRYGAEWSRVHYAPPPSGSTAYSTGTEQEVAAAGTTVAVGPGRYCPPRRRHAF